MCVILLLCLYSFKSHAKVTDDVYALMPPVFHYDDYDRCLLMGLDAVYCTVTIELSPVSLTNASKIWKIIEEESRPAKNYKHYKLRYGVCVWLTCSQYAQNVDLNSDDDLKHVISDCYTDKLAKIGVKAQVTEIHTQRGAQTTLDDYNKFLFLCLIGLLATLVVCGSLYEGCARYESREVYDRRIKLSGFGRIISSFSLLKNWEALCSPFQTVDAAALKCIQGVRFFTILSIISTHANYFIGLAGMHNTREAENIFGTPITVGILNNTYACQAFLVVSAWLLSYHFCLIFENNEKPQLRYLVLALINRYIRLTPTLIFLIILSTWGSYVIGQGPISFKTMSYFDPCYETWWSNLLYINNYYNVKNMCLPHTWYLATDIQLYALSLVILGIIWKYRRHVRLIFGISLLVAILIPIVHNYVSDYDITMRITPEMATTNPVRESEIMRKMYMTAHNNMGAYVIGLIFGYLFHATRKKNVFTNKLYVFLWYVLVIFPPLIIVVVLGIPIFSEDYVNNRLLAALYVGIGRNVVSFSIALCIYGVSKGIGGFIRHLLLSAPFQVLGKLCYCTYLFHVMIIIERTAKQRFPSYFQVTSLISQIFGDIGLSFLLALVVCLCVELPLQSLQKLYVPQINDKKNKE